jgi:hypothetical protein
MKLMTMIPKTPAETMRKRMAMLLDEAIIGPVKLNRAVATDFDNLVEKLALAAEQAMDPHEQLKDAVLPHLSKHYPERIWAAHMKDMRVTRTGEIVEVRINGEPGIAAMFGAKAAGIE